MTDAISCRDFIEFLADYLDETLAADRRAAFEVCWSRWADPSCSI